MKYYSTSDKNIVVSLEQAVMTGLAPDGGLYMPEYIPKFSESDIKYISSLSFAEIASRCASLFFDSDMNANIIAELCHNAFTFDAPLVHIDSNIYSLELFHGPTLAFKDFGARFMAQLMGYFVQLSDKELTILVATSGDTGSAVGSGFYKVQGIRVLLLYPSGKVSTLQEKQLTTMGENITALEIDGTFDDCQRLVKTAFTDSDLQTSIKLSSANSINIARLLPQSFYYWYAWTQLNSGEAHPIFCVPSGNFGNLTAGLIAKQMGMPVTQFIAATNANRTFVNYMNSGRFVPQETILTLSNAMDVGNPSNFARINDLYQYNVESIRKNITATSFDDAQTLNCISRVKDQFDYLLDPHTAVGFLGLESYLNKHKTDRPAIVLGTAHPAKFPDAIKRACNIEIDLPPALKLVCRKEKNSIPLSNKFADFKDLLINLK